MKRILNFQILALASLLAGFSLTSCQSLRSEYEIDTPAKKTVDGSSMVQLRIAVPLSDPVLYEKTRAMIHDEKEYEVEHVSIYMFDGKNNILLVDPIVLKKNPGTNEIALGNGQLIDGEMVYQFEFDMKSQDFLPYKDEYVYFVAVANEMPNTTLKRGGSLRDLQRVLARKVQEGNKTSALVVNGQYGDATYQIPMTGFSQKANLSNGSGSFVLPLRRIVARIDIDVQVDADFQVNDVTLQMANSRSYLLGDAGNLPSTNTFLSGIKPFNPNIIGSKAGGTFDKVFYLYEGLMPASKNNATTVVVEATYLGKAYRYVIPFWNETENIGVPVERNHIYRIKFGTSKKSKAVEFGLETADWRFVALHKNWLSFTPLFVSATPALADSPLEDEVVTLDNGEREVTLLLSNFFTRKPNVEVTFDNTTGFYTTEPAYDPATQKLTFKVSENATGVERNNVISVANSNEPDAEPLKLMVVQK